MTTPETGDPGDPTPALGTVLDEGRGSLPYLLVHGESLVACAAWALGDAQVTAIDLGTPWEAVVESGQPFVVHDALCPLTPAAFIAACVERAAGSGAVVVGVDALDRVLAPVVLPAAVVAGLDGLPSTDLAVLVEALGPEVAIDRVRAPEEAARVASAADVAALEALTTPERP